MDPTHAIPDELKNESSESEETLHVNQELYKKNLELAERNKTLSLLRKIDAVILSTVTDIQQIAQQVANIVVDEAEYIKFIIILLYDKNQKILYRLSTSQTESIRKAELEVGDSFHSIRLHLSNVNNIIISAITDKRMKRTNNLLDVLPAHITPEQAKIIQEIIGNTSTLIYPLNAREEFIGAMLLGIDEKEKPLSFYRIDLIDRLPGIVAISIDNALLYQELHNANNQLKQLDRLKDEFVSLASHELRTPLTAIKSYLWLLLEQRAQTLDEKAKLYIERSYSAAERLIKMVNDMLNISRIESGRLAVNMEPVNINSLMQDTITELIPTAQKEEISIQFVPQNANLIALADPEKTRGVIQNIIGNAIKFTPKSGVITITNSLQDGFAQIAIKDTGRGIDKEDIKKLFQKFEMVGKDVLKRQDNKQGTGLGLYIAKSIIELMGGRIWATSDGENNGTTFYFTLKLASSQKTATTPL